MASLKDVAHLAGVSMMTVSRVINQGTGVSDTTRQRVTRAIEALNYVPDLSAQKMRGQASKPLTLAVLAEDTATTPFSVEILLAIEKTANQYGWNSFIINIFSSTDTERAVRELLAHRPDGIIYTTMGLRQVHLPASLSAIPIVLANCYSEDPHLASYIPDDFNAQYQATQHLLNQGYRRPLCFWLPEHQPATELRRQGFEQAWIDGGQSLHDVQQYHMTAGDEHYLELAPLLESLLSRESVPFDCLVCGNDRSAFVAYQQLLTMGIRIPQQIAVLGFDNMVGVGHLFLPALTTVQLPHAEIGRQASLHLIEQRTSDGIHRLECPLLVRAST